MSLFFGFYSYSKFFSTHRIANNFLQQTNKGIREVLFSMFQYMSHNLFRSTTLGSADVLSYVFSTPYNFFSI